MIKSYQSKKTIEACQWFGNNRLELEDFLGKENVDFVIYSNKDPVPTVVTNNGDTEVKLKDFVVLDEEKISVYSENDFFELYENI